MLSISLAVWLVFASAPGDLEAAKRHFDAAEKLFAQRRFAEAAAAFHSAQALRPHPALFFNLGQCHEHLGDAGRAADYYRAYLREVADAPDRAVVQAAIDRLDPERPAPPPLNRAALEPAAALAQAAPSRGWLPGMYASGALSLIAVGSGVGFGMGALSAQRDLRGDVHSRERAQRLFDTAAERATISNVSYGVAAAAAGTALLFYLFARGEGDEAGAP